MIFRKDPMSTSRPITPRYASLPLLALLLKLLGYLILLYSIVAAGHTVWVGRSAFNITEPLVHAAGLLFYGVLYAILIIAGSELIHVVLDIEENTRRASDAANETITGTTPRT